MESGTTYEQFEEREMYRKSLGFFYGRVLRCGIQCLRYLLLIAIFPGSSARADTFGSGANSFEIEFVTVGAPGNPAEGFPSLILPKGTVDRTFRMGKYEISEEMIDKANAQSAADGVPLDITHYGRGANLPAVTVSWYEAARFVNWLNTSTGAAPAYNFDSNGEFQLWQLGDAGFDPSNPYRDTRARYFLPSADEWHKAAFYDPVAGLYYDFATGSNVLPDGIDFAGDPDFEAVYYDGGANELANAINNVGLPSPFGTFGQDGNVSEWEESAYDLTNDETWEDRAIRGSYWYGTYHELGSTSRNAVGPFYELQSNIVGFRVASVPEPSSCAIFGFGVIFGMLTFCRQRDVL